MSFDISTTRKPTKVCTTPKSSRSARKTFVRTGKSNLSSLDSEGQSVTYEEDSDLSVNKQIKKRGTYKKRPKPIYDVCPEKSGRWTEEEHEKLIKALELYGNIWSKIAEYIGTRSRDQIRSHVQKHFLKVKKEKLKEMEEKGEIHKKVFLITKEYRNNTRYGNVLHKENMGNLIKNSNEMQGLLTSLPEGKGITQDKNNDSLVKCDTDNIIPQIPIEIIPLQTESIKINDSRIIKQESFTNWIHAEAAKEYMQEYIVKQPFESTKESSDQRIEIISINHEVQELKEEFENIENEEENRNVNKCPFQMGTKWSSNEEEILANELLL